MFVPISRPPQRCCHLNQVYYPTRVRSRCPVRESPSGPRCRTARPGRDLRLEQPLAGAVYTHGRSFVPRVPEVPGTPSGTGPGGPSSYPNTTHPGRGLFRYSRIYSLIIVIYPLNTFVRTFSACISTRSSTATLLQHRPIAPDERMYQNEPPNTDGRRVDGGKGPATARPGGVV